MPEGRFTCNEAEIKYVIDTSTITGDAGKFNSIMAVPVNLIFQQKYGADNHNKEANGMFCHLIGMEAKLIYQNSNLSFDNSFPNRTIYFNRDNPFKIQFPLDKEKTALLEQLRKKHLELNISVQLTIALFSDIKTATGQSQSVISKFTWAQGEMLLKFSQSEWINLLPMLGHKAFELVEIPLSNELIGEQYDDTIKELKRSKHYLESGDYDKVVAHCRTALEPIRGRFPNLKDHVKKNLSSEWIDIANNATLEWLDKIFKFQADVTNKTHHVPSIGHFSKNEAEAIYLLTVATISIGGSLQSIKN